METQETDNVGTQSVHEEVHDAALLRE